MKFFSKKIFLVFLFINSIIQPVISQNNDCVSWANLPTYSDGIQYCPEYNGYSIFNCPFKQGRIFNKPTSSQGQLRRKIIMDLKERNYTALLTDCAKDKLRVCRVNNSGDTFLNIVVEPGINNYNGAFLQFREKNSIPIIIQTPHDGSDGTSNIGVLAFENSRALFHMMNGQSKGVATDKVKCENPPRAISDAAHSVQHGFFTWNQAIAQYFPTTKFLHCHGKEGSTLTATNGLARPTTNTSFISAFARASVEAYKKVPNYQDKLFSCVKGTVFKYQDQCSLRNTWVPVKALTGSKSPQCAAGQNDWDRIVGFETPVDVFKKQPTIIADIINILDKNYFKGQLVDFSDPIDNSNDYPNEENEE